MVYSIKFSFYMAFKKDIFGDIDRTHSVAGALQTS
jgi:hypothetical protein